MIVAWAWPVRYSDTAMVAIALNARQESFVRLVAQGRSGREAYQKAGYPVGDAVADANAARLLANAKVKARLVQLQAAAARKVEKDLATLVAELDDAFRMAKEDRNPAAMVAATAMTAKLLGLVVNRNENVEVLHKPSAMVDAPREMAVEEWLEKYAPQARQQ